MHDFVHLRLHTEFSITNSVLRIKDAVKLAKDKAMLALGLSDQHNLFALIKFYKECYVAGIKPIIGTEVNVINAEFKYRLILLAKNLRGYQQICHWLSLSYVQNKIDDIAYLKEEWLLAGVQQDIIVLSGGVYGDLAKLLTKPKAFKKKAALWQEYYADNYFLEIQRFSQYSSDELVKQSLVVASELAIAMVATHPIQFANADDYLAHEVRVCVANGERLDDGERKVKYSADQYFKSKQEMNELFSDIPSALYNTVEIAKKCNLEITLGTYFLPNFATPNNTPLEEYLSVVAHQGLDTRLIELFADVKQRLTEDVVYRKRLELEIETIIQMGFAGYFLIVADFINWAKKNNVPVGPGRGSGAGSVVAFALGITDVDPLRYSLLFERFLNPERVSMPDFDIDFCQDKRELVIRYVQDKYSVDAVAQIATFGTMSSKAVIKDVGRVLGLPYGLCDSLSKLILNTPAKSWKLLDAYAEFAELKNRIDNADDDLRRLWDLSLQLEDLTRSVGKHAAGVLIAPSKLSDFCPLYVADGMQTSQLDKDDVESIGLVKFDFLGLRNLTIIQEAIHNVEAVHKVKLQLSNYEFEDAKVYQLLQAGNTTAVFQLESQGMKRLLVKLEPNRFEDIIAVLALYRPGPLGSGMVDDFVKRKKGEAAIDYFHPDLQEVLEPTYGVIVYQEQVMQISLIIGGYTLGGADLLRRAMGKKKKEEMDEHRAIFIAGAIKKGYKESLAEKLFDLMAMFAEYGFNKSHTAAYAVVSYHTAYLKAHYSACFMASTLSSELDKTDKLYEFYQDCRANNLTVLPPDINHSYYRFTPLNANTIRYALGALKGLGQQVVNLIVEEREKNGVFHSLLDFCKRIDKKAINKKTLESLVKSGCFDSLEPNRAKLFNNLGKIVGFIEQQRINENQGSLFDCFSLEEQNADLDIQLDDYPPFTLKQQLQLEKQAIGYYLTASLFDEYQDIIRRLNIWPLVKFNLEDEEVQELISSKQKPRPKILISGIVNYIGSRPTKKGGKISFIRIEDLSAELEFVVFNDDYEQYKRLLKEDELVIVEGEVIYDAFRDEIKINAQRVFSLDEALQKLVQRLELEISDVAKWDEVQELLQLNADASGEIKLNYQNPQAKCSLLLGLNGRFVPTFTKFNELNQRIGKTSWGLVLNRV